MKDCWTENIKQNKIGEFIEQQEQHFPVPKDNIAFKREYHMLTRGLILNEIVRRIHPEVGFLQTYHKKRAQQ